jgi:hypothetical protein
MARVAIPGSFGVVNGVVTFTPTSNLPNNTQIFVTVTPSVRGTANQRLATNYLFDFTTIDAVLLLSSSVPADDAEEVAISTTIAMTFSHNILGSTANATNIVIIDADTEDVIAGSFATLNKVVTFTPTNPLSYNQNIQVTISVDVKGTNHEALATPVVLTFLTIGDAMTVSETDPLDEAGDVAVDTTIEVTFSVNIDENTVDSDSFKVEYDDGQE